jgi:hypothetical protein
MGPGDEIACTVEANDVYSVLRLRVDTLGARRIDLVFEASGASHRYPDVPVDADPGELVYVQPGEYLRTIPSGRKTLRLIAVEDAGERVLGEYRLDHTAFVPQRTP